MTPAELIGLRLVASFRGLRAPDHVLHRVRSGPLGGFTLFRSLNVADPGQVRQLTAELQQAAREAHELPLLIAADQEGGQLIALGDATTPFPGNLALGATRDADLAREVGAALGREIAAMGVNVNFAPVCDVNSNPVNPVVGTRSFGEDPLLVAEFSAAMVEGLQSTGVAAVGKHFPGHGDTASDSHYGVPVVEADRERLERVELLPFKATIAAGVRAIMAAHVALPVVTADHELPSTLSRAVLRDLLRGELGFEAVVVCDALDMGALEQGSTLAIEAIAAAAAGNDLLLLGPSVGDYTSIEAALAHALRRGLLDTHEAQASADRVMALKRWIASAEQPPLSVIGSPQHRTLAATVAERSITVVRDDSHTLPLRPSAFQRIGVILPRLADLTPADTSSYVQHTLVEHVRRRHSATLAIDVSADPDADEIEAVVARTAGCEVLIVATVNAYAQPGQAALVNALIERGLPMVVVALRMPYDLMACAQAATFVCAFSALEPSMRALVAVLFGEAAARGWL
ncbi:MAG TPA: glycoside hydrolase family 3 N-terminal domain-containing protein, partial [Chloroflexota bacterium]|nr:glycoside hydrolase family 3 N-terminal domain-containing protein [Chloroflexota bacterium]